ncbi:MAG: phosphatidate cytidylyltransferase [Tissierellia bacterium]|nr:phosphatidate cytidylyltransferase [Tissierellia bacterium]
MRVIVAIFGIIILSAVLYIGGIIINIAVFFLILIGLFELRKAFLKLDIKLKSEYLFLISIFNFLEVYFFNSIIFTVYFIMVLSLFDLLFLRNNIMNVSILTFSLFYVILGFSSIALIQNSAFIGLIFIIAFSTDSFAYLVGISLGKHKLIPDVSPKKSIEGAIGGIVATVIITTLYLSYFGIGILPIDLILGFTGSIIAQCGDLVASRIKRDTGIKDFGHLIPGHGGIIDRFDSVILVAPVVLNLYFYFYF